MIIKKEQAINELNRIGIAKDEIDKLMETFPYDQVAAGEIKYETIKISINSIQRLGYSVQIAEVGLGLSKATWASILVNSIGWKITMLLSLMAALASTMIIGPTGIKIDLTLEWGYGDNSMEWQWIPIDFRMSNY